MGEKDQVCTWERDDSGRAQTVCAPSAHAGIVKALNASFARPAALPPEWQRMLDRLR